MLKFKIVYTVIIFMFHCFNLLGEGSKDVASILTITYLCPIGIFLECEFIQTQSYCIDNKIKIHRYHDFLKISCYCPSQRPVALRSAPASTRATTLRFSAIVVPYFTLFLIFCLHFYTSLRFLYHCF